MSRFVLVSTQVYIRILFSTFFLVLTIVPFVPFPLRYTSPGTWMYLALNLELVQPRDLKFCNTQNFQCTVTRLLLVHELGLKSHQDTIFPISACISCSVSLVLRGFVRRVHVFIYRHKISSLRHLSLLHNLMLQQSETEIYERVI